MITRKLVEIPLKHHAAMVRLRNEYRKRGIRGPSIPDLVAFAVERGMPFLLQEFNPAKTQRER